MLTMMILGIVMTIVYGVFAQTISAKERVEGRAEEMISARATLSRIGADLTSVRVPAAGRPVSAANAQVTPTPRMGETLLRPQTGLFLGRVRTDQGVAVDDLSFSALVRRPTALTYAASDLGIVHYFVDRSLEDPRARGLYRETIFSLSGDGFDPDKPNLGATTLLLPGVTGFDVRFYDGTQWVEEWDSTDGRSFAPAPFAVQIALTVTNEQGESETYTTAFDLPMMRGLRKPQVAAPTPTP
jgi:type II secretion system (T2SS) protein J